MNFWRWTHRCSWTDALIRHLRMFEMSTWYCWSVKLLSTYVWRSLALRYWYCSSFEPPAQTLIVLVMVLLYSVRTLQRWCCLVACVKRQQPQISRASRKLVMRQQQISESGIVRRCVHTILPATLFGNTLHLLRFVISSTKSVEPTDETAQGGEVLLILSTSIWTQGLCSTCGVRIRVGAILGVAITTLCICSPCHVRRLVMGYLYKGLHLFSFDQPQVSVSICKLVLSQQTCSSETKHRKICRCTRGLIIGEIWFSRHWIDAAS